MQRDGKRIAQPHSAGDEDGGESAEKAECNIEPFRTGEDKRGERHGVACNQRGLSPLAGGDPCLLADQKHHRDDANTGGVEKVFIVDADGEFETDTD